MKPICSQNPINKVHRLAIFVILVVMGAACQADQLQGSVVLDAIDLDGEDTTRGQFDLDTGGFSEQGGGDLRFTSGHGSMEFLGLDPENGALAISVGRLEVGLEGCQSALEDALGGNVPEIIPGTYVCVLTTQGNISRVRVENLYPGVNDRMEISYMTWFVSNE